MSLLEDQQAHLPKDWNYLIGGGMDVTGCKFTIDCRPPVIAYRTDGSTLVFIKYADYHNFIKELFNPKKHVS